MPLGIIAIIYAVMAGSACESGSAEKAKQYAAKAAMWSNIGVLSTILGGLIWFLMIFGGCASLF